MTTDAEERAIEVMAKAIRLALKHWMINVGDEEAKFAGRAAYAALRAHDAETLNRVVMDSEGNVVRDET